VPRKIRELIKALEAAGFRNNGGKGSHRNFKHAKTGSKVIISGQPGADAKPYQEQEVEDALRRAGK